MAHYVDGFVVPVPTARIEEYRRFSETAGRIWKEYGALQYESREQRDAVNAKGMSDPRMKDMDPKTMPFDGTRMFWGGFKTIVEI